MTNGTADRAVLTIATGKPIYLKMAINLARSFLLWHQNSDIKFILVTDHDRPLPEDLKNIEVMRIKPGRYGKGFSVKLYLDQFSTASKLLFVDADCLCVGSLEPIFARFRGHSVSVIGQVATDGDFFGNVAQICSRFNINGIPRFVGGVYYLELGETARRVFSTARELEQQYDQLGLIRLRGVPNEEPLMAIAMALNGQFPLPEDGSVKADSMFYPSKVSVDVFRGYASLWNLHGGRKYHPGWPLRESRPVIVHFNCSFSERRHYRREAVRMEKVCGEGWPLVLATAYAWTTCSVPEIVSDLVKDALRPAYRRIFGARSLKISARI